MTTNAELATWLRGEVVHLFESWTYDGKFGDSYACRLAEIANRLDASYETLEVLKEAHVDLADFSIMSQSDDALERSQYRTYRDILIAKMAAAIQKATEPTNDQ